jgi:hypothetical protein
MIFACERQLVTTTNDQLFDKEGFLVACCEENCQTTSFILPPFPHCNYKINYNQWTPQCKV